MRDTPGPTLPRKRGFTRRNVLKGLGATVLSGVALAGYAFGIEPRYRLRTTHYALSPPKWPKDLKLKIAIVADIHAGEPYMPVARIAEIVARTNALKPDLTLLLGDYAASHKWQVAQDPGGRMGSGPQRSDRTAWRPCRARQSRLVG